MATAKINFTDEHQKRLFDLATNMLFNGGIVKGLAGSTLTIFDLIHNTSVRTLSDINAGLRKEISRIETLDDWSMTDYQQKKLTTTKETQELVHLLIGYKKYLEQLDNDKSKLTELKAKRAELKKSTMTPEQQLAELDAEIASLGGDVEEVPASTATAPASINAGSTL